jgi:hypothetical protein
MEQQKQTHNNIKDIKVTNTFQSMKQRQQQLLYQQHSLLKKKIV